jgi:hypothetical protein
MNGICLLMILSDEARAAKSKQRIARTSERIACSGSVAPKSGYLPGVA